MLKKPAALKQPNVSHLVRNLRQVMGLTQEQFAAVLGVTYTTVNRWENGHMQPSPLALKQIKAMLKAMSLSAEIEQSEPCDRLLAHYFPEAFPEASSTL